MMDTGSGRSSGGTSEKLTKKNSAQYLQEVLGECLEAIFKYSLKKKQIQEFLISKGISEKNLGGTSGHPVTFLRMSQELLEGLSHPIWTIISVPFWKQLRSN